MTEPARGSVWTSYGHEWGQCSQCGAEEPVIHAITGQCVECYHKTTAPRPLVSVITATWGRRDLLLETVRHLEEQTYPYLQHVVVIEGKDPELVLDLQRLRPLPRTMLTVVECGRNWTTYLKNSRNAAPMIVGQLVAQGERLCWCPDDDRMAPDHITKLCDLMDRTGADFCYSMTEMWRKDNPSHRYVIGGPTPRYGEVTNVLYSARLIEKGLTRLNAGGCPDWLQIRDWLEAGATWAFLPEVTLSHRVDL